jgi:hypothetical protein
MDDEETEDPAVLEEIDEYLTECDAFGRLPEPPLRP